MLPRRQVKVHTPLAFFEEFILGLAQRRTIRLSLPPISKPSAEIYPVEPPHRGKSYVKDTDHSGEEEGHPTGGGELTFSKRIALRRLPGVEGGSTPSPDSELWMCPEGAYDRELDEPTYEHHGEEHREPPKEALLVGSYTYLGPIRKPPRMRL